jgi:hypothetical protein
MDNVSLRFVYHIPFVKFIVVVKTQRLWRTRCERWDTVQSTRRSNESHLPPPAEVSRPPKKIVAYCGLDIRHKHSSPLPRHTMVPLQICDALSRSLHFPKPPQNPNPHLPHSNFPYLKIKTHLSPDDARDLCSALATLGPNSEMVHGTRFLGLLAVLICAPVSC